MQIVDLNSEEHLLYEAAALLCEGFSHMFQSPWSDLQAALAEARASLRPDGISRAALDEDGCVVGWIAAAPFYNGFVWEIHPLVVAGNRRGQGIGRRLVEDVARLAAGRGGVTLWVGTDDEDERTSLGGIDLYPDPLAHLARIRNLKHHPYTFYQRLGFVLAGVLPDANGFGKPDIFLARRIAPPLEDTLSA
jgi:aminoglycoside 6'-N-acetyltransferase I